MITILLKFIASAALLFAFYRIVLRGKASYTVSRVYLLLLPVVSLIMAVLTFEVYPTGTEIAIERFEPAATTFESEPSALAVTVPTAAPAPVAAPSATAPSVEVGEPAKAEHTIVIDWYATLQWVIPAISLLLLLIAVYYICRVMVIKSKMEVETTAEGYSLIHSSKVDTPFSFAKTIFLPTSLNEPGKSMIIRHEKAHISHRHYADVWFSEFMTRLFWFNPFVWLCRSELRNVHEFQADHDVVTSNIDVSAYQTTLLEMVMNVSSPVVNGFNHSFIRRRFIEMKKTTAGTLGRVAKIGTLVWIGAMFCAFTFTEKKPEPVQIAEETSVQATDVAVAAQTLGNGKFVIEGSVDPGITDSCYLIYFGDENFEIIETPVACVPVENKKFHYEVELNDLTLCRIRCIFPGGEICSAWIETLAAPGTTFELTVHNGYYSSESLYNGYLTTIRRLANAYCKNHHLNDNVAQPSGLYKTWENVKFGSWDNHKVEKVDFGEKKTVVTLSMTHWERADLNSDVCLRDTAGNLYKMLHNETSGNRYIDYICGARYSFEPLPKGVTQFDIVQKVTRRASFINENGQSQSYEVNGKDINVIVENIREDLNVNHEPNFSITFKTALTKEVVGFEIVQTQTDERRALNSPLGDVELNANGEATFSTYLEEPIIVYVFPIYTDSRRLKSYSILFPLIPGEKAAFTLTSTGSVEEDRETGVIKIERPEHELTGKGFYKYWNEAEKELSKISNENASDFEKVESLQREYMKRHNDNLGSVMQYVLHWRADYSVLSKKILQNPMVKQMKERDDAWAKEREESLKRREEARANTAPGKMFVDLDLLNMTNTNNRPSLSDIVGKGRHVLVYFSYTDDGAIKDSVEAVWKKHKGGKVDVIGIKCTHISSSDFYDKIYKDMGISYKLYYDTSHKSYNSYGLGKDEVILFGPDGTILWRDIAADELELTIENVLNGKATTHPVYSNPLQDSKFKAMNIYNFTKQVEWPARETKGDFVICVVNQDNMLKQLESITKGKTVGKSTISVVGAKSIDEISKCHILYLPTDESSADKIKAVAAKLGNAATLIVSDNPGALENGSCINFVMIDDKIKFEVDQKAIEDRKMKVNPALISRSFNN